MALQPRTVTASPPLPSLSVVLATYNERDNLGPMLGQLRSLLGESFQLQILVVDDDSPDGSSELVRQLSRSDPRIQLIRRVGRNGLSSAIREGLLAASGELAVVMDADGQHEPAAVQRALQLLQAGDLDLVIGSRFHPQAHIAGLSAERQQGSQRANRLARLSLPAYAQLTDFMSGFFALRPDRCYGAIRAVDVSGFKFLYELLAVSKGRLRVEEIPLDFQARRSGISKLDNAVVWDWLVSLVHTATLRLVPRRAVSFGLVGLSGMVVHFSLYALLRGLGLAFFPTQVVAVICAASCNYLINNSLTFRARRLRGRSLSLGLLKFLLVSSLGMAANVGVSTVVFEQLHGGPIALVALLAGITVDFVWKYAASSRFVWNVPY
jgi:dolichol-phosphate mannosyltransferase